MLSYYQYQLSMPRVSILIATYNRGHLISKAIESILEQSFKDWEIIVADGPSTDNTEEVINDWKTKIPQIKYIRSDMNTSIARSSNNGLRQASGEYIAILDDDDRWRDKDKLKKQVEFLDNNPDYVAVGGGMVVINENDQELFRYLKPETNGRIRDKFLFDNPMANSTTLFRYAAAAKVGFYDETLRQSADRDFWLKMGLVGKLYNFPEYLTYYLMAGQNTSIVKMRDTLSFSLKIMKRYKNNYPNYWPALLFNRVQYMYVFLPQWLKRILHLTLAKLKRIVFK